MRRTLIALALAAGALAPAAVAADPVPFPAPTVQQLFVSANTVSADGSASNYFAPGATVIFRAAAVDNKTHKVIGAKDATYFYVTIPNQPNVKLKYDPKAPGATAQQPWTGAWNVPTTYATGVVEFKVLVKTKAKRRGQFVQLPVRAAQLTISAKPPVVPTAAVPAPATQVPAKLDVSLYVDSVNGTRPAAAAPRPIGCTQTNVYKRGEQFVLRAWGSDIASGAVLSADNVDEATAVIPGQPTLKLNWSGHGTAPNQVWFWSNFWNIPTDYALGDVTIKVTFKTDAGKTGTFDYPITIIP